MTNHNNHAGGSSPLSSQGRHTGHGTPSTNLTMMSPDAGYHASYNPNGVVLRSSEQTSQSSGSAIQFARHGYTVQGLSPNARVFQPIGVQGPHGYGTSPYPIHREPALRLTQNQVSVTVTQAHNVRLGTFSADDQSWRAIIVSAPELIDAEHRIVLLFSPTRFPSLRGIDASQARLGIYKIAFNDVRDARQAFALASMDLVDTGATISWLKPRQLAAALGQDNVECLSDHDGELLVSLIAIHGDQSMTFGHFFQLIDGCGDVKAVHWRNDPNPRIACFRVEFYDVAALERFQSKHHGEVRDDYRIHAYNFTPDVATRVLTVATNAVASVTGRSVVAQSDIDKFSSVMPRIMGRGNRGSHNHVSIQRIQSGQDVRTTVMLRNIPNKVTQQDLKRYLDETSFGEYDFMYLRIDFANKCNVGYAFVNFIDPVAIINFARVRNNQYWNVHESNKRAEISYATIQGSDCLIQKFRNSSVMLEDPSYRPKLFFTYSDHRAGHDKEFPAPDNFSKMRRSIENAETIGLWIPSRGLSRAARIANGRQYSQPARQAFAAATYLARGRNLSRAVVVHNPIEPVAVQSPQATTDQHNVVHPVNTDQAHHLLRAIDVNDPNDPFFGRGHGRAPTQTDRRFH